MAQGVQGGRSGLRAREAVKGKGGVPRVRWGGGKGSWLCGRGRGGAGCGLGETIVAFGVEGRSG